MDSRSLLSYLLEPEPEVRVSVFDPWRYALRSFDHHHGNHPHKQCLAKTPELFSDYLKELQKDFETVQKLDESGFHFRIDVQDYQPEEINVKLEDNVVCVEGKHEERSDAHGTISRQFVRKFVVPKGVVDIDKLSSSLSSDGVLTITAPRLEAIENNKSRNITIEKTGPVKESIKPNEEQK